MDCLPQNCYIGSGSSQEATDMACIQGKNHEQDFTLEISPGYDMEVPNLELDCTAFSGGSCNFQQVWLSHGGGESSSHDFLNPNLEENYQLTQLDHMENFINFPYTDDGQEVHELLSRNSNILPTMNFSGHSAGDVLKPISAPGNLVSNAHPTWKAVESSTDNVHPMSHFSGHCTSQLDKQICSEIDENPSGETNNVAPTVRVYWTPRDDELLKNLVMEHGEGKWALLAKNFPTRNGKNLRERWKNHVKPDINKKEEMWADEEDEILIKAHMQYGNRWSKISTLLPGRTENAVKNHWNTNRRKNFSKAFAKNKQTKAIGPLQRYIGIQDGLPAYSTANTTTPGSPSNSVGNINPVNAAPVPGHNAPAVMENFDPMNSTPVPGHNNTDGVNEASEVSDFSDMSALPELVPNPMWSIFYHDSSCLYLGGFDVQQV